LMLIGVVQVTFGLAFRSGNGGYRICSARHRYIRILVGTPITATGRH
jgi:hypothetical protein